MWAQVFFVLSQCPRLTDGQTDRQTERLSQYRAALHYMQSHGKNLPSIVERPKSIGMYRIYSIHNSLFDSNGCRIRSNRPNAVWLNAITETTRQASVSISEWDGQRSIVLLSVICCPEALVVASCAQTPSLHHDGVQRQPDAAENIQILFSVISVTPLLQRWQLDYQVINYSHLIHILPNSQK